MKPLSLLLLALLVICCAQKKDHQLIEVFAAQQTPVIDGKATEDCWKTAQWHLLDQVWLGEELSPKDFQGRYKLTWTPEGLFLLVEVQDDVLFDQYQDPLTLWWDDDCVEVFVDEDNSGGEHQYNHNAFAYHVALDGNVVDMDTTQEGRLYNDHVSMQRNTQGNHTLWELKVKVFDDSYVDEGVNQPVTLEAEKKVGFALAYCDNDRSKQREHFIGSVVVPGEDKNRGWIDAGIFGTLILKNAP